MSVGVAERPGTGAKVDPRIAARRRSVEQERRGRRRRRLLVLALVVTVVAAAWFATRTALLDVDDIEVRGTVTTPVEDVVAASGVAPGEPLVGLDTGTVAAHVEALPWVASADVERSIDGRVTITVTERTPVAVVLGEGDAGAVLVDDTGRVLGPAPDSTEHLVRLTGVEPVDPGATIEGAADALGAFDALGPGARTRVAAVGRSDDGSIVLGLVPQGLVVLGPPTDLAGKAAALTTLLGQIDQTDLETISLVDPSDPVVVRRTTG